MRLWHLTLGIGFAALLLAISRDVVGRVALVVFFMGLGEVVLGTTAVMALFQSLGALGAAHGLREHVASLAETAMVLLVASLTMNGLLWIGLWVLQVVLPPV